MKDVSIGKIKYLHIMTDTNFAVTGTFVSMVNNYFENGLSEHFFLINYREFTAPEYLKQYKNVIIIENMGTSRRGMKILFEYLHKAEHVIWHSLGWYWTLQLKVSMSKSICKKSLWIPWGRDLYDFTRYTKKFPRNIYDYLTNEIMVKLRKKIQYACVIFPKDAEIAKKYIKDSDKIFEARYTTFSSNDVDRVKPAETHECVNILLGHSSNKCLNHFESLEDLKKFKDENIKIYVILAYGDKIYAKQVEDKALEIFKDKAIIVKDTMSADEYTKLLWKMDVAIFNSSIQVGLGNICRLLYMGCKIYTKTDGMLYKELKEHDCNVYPSEGISSLDFNEFCDKSGITPSKWAEDTMDISKTAKMWKDAFEKL